MFAGHDTTSSALSRALHCLAMNAAEQEKLRREVAASGILDRDGVSYDELMALPYLDAVVRETLRVHAPVPFTIRRAMDDEVIPVGEPYTDRHGEVRDDIR